MRFSSYHPALLLTLFMFVGMSLLLLTDQVTEDRRHRQAQAALAKTLREVAPVTLPPDQSWHDIPYHLQAEIPSSAMPFMIETVYPIYQDQRPSGYIIRLAVPGYNGKIRLLAGVDADFALHKLRVVSHNETPGLGDRIEAGKSDWINGFDKLALDDQSTEQKPRPQPVWHLHKHGGEFDDLTGATITAQAILNGVHDALLYLRANPPNTPDAQPQ